MRNLRLRLRFNGSAYHGWQIQANAVTVQGLVENAISGIFGGHHTVYGCSRTDAGVHANEFFCNFRTEKGIPCDAVVKALNANLPYDIAVTHCCEMPLDFHSRYSCSSKEYVYRIRNSPVRDPFSVTTAYHYRYPLDETLLDKTAKDYIGTHDFGAFCSSGCSVDSTVRTVKNAAVERQNDMVLFTVEADGFLYNMVRIMVGTLLGVNEGKIGSDAVPSILLSKNREKAGITAPPQGLFLNHVKYEGW